MSHDRAAGTSGTGAATDLADIPVDRRHWIGGQRVAGNSGDEFELFSPIDMSSLGAIAAGGPAEVADAVAAAQAAFPSWAALGPGGRATVLHRFAQGIVDHRHELSTVETVDNGSLLGGNLRRVVDRAAHNIAFFADHAVALADRSASSPLAGPVVDNYVRHEPAGVAALIVPWNAPLLLSTWKIGPALAAGDTVVLKPAEWAPLSCSLLADVAHEAGVPPGVLNVVQGTGTTGYALVQHPEVDRISFTGSTAIGRMVGAAAADSVTPVSLELGGKSPFVVFADADLDAAAATVAQQFTNAGQVCLAGTRLLVERSIAAAFQQRVLRAAADATVGDPRRQGVRVGPLIHPRQRYVVAGYVDGALDAGANVLIGGSALGGCYYPPTILDGVAPDAEVVTDEIFGPVLTWQTFGSESEALELTNATRYGLTAVVFTGDRARAERIAAGIVAGTVWVNCYFVRDLAAPFGGARRSGIGREGGTWSFDFFCDVKNVALRRGSFVETPSDAPTDDLASGEAKPGAGDG